MKTLKLILKKAQGLMGEVPKTTEETKPEDQESIPHLVSTEEEGSGDGETYLRPDFIPEKFWGRKRRPGHRRDVQKSK